MKSILVLFSLFVSLNVFSQLKTFEKAKKAYASGNLKGANKLLDQCIENKETKNNPNVLLLKSKVLFAISKDYSISEKFPGALKDATKFAEKAINTIEEERFAAAFREANKEYILLLAKEINKEAVDAYYLKKYSKALPLLKKCIFFTQDTQAMVLAADCYWEMDQKDESLPLFRQSAEIIYNAVSDGNSKVYGYQKEPFRKLGNYYIKKKDYDSAYLIVKKGREILPSDAILNQYTYELMPHVLDQIPPSEDYLRAVQNGLKDFPEDSFLNHRENSIYIYLLNGMAGANEQDQFDSLMKRYASSKEEKLKLKKINEVKRYDIFAGQSSNEFNNALLSYFSKLGLKEATYSLWRYKTGRYSADGKTVKTDKELAETLLKENNVQIAEYVFDRHLSLYPKSIDFTKSRGTYTSAKNKSALQYYDLLPMVNLCDASAKDFPKLPEYKNASKMHRLRLISESADSGNFRLGRKIWTETQKQFPDQQKSLEALWRKMVENDFRFNYFGSRINPKGKNEPNVPEYLWKGAADSCKEGVMPMEIVIRVENRINYFRRMAGLTEEIVLSKQDNQVCMMAAMMCEANKSMSHDPSDGWRCFIPAGLDALRNSILSKDGNPCIAVTSAMGQNHATVGNRRWLLYPNAQYMGVGSSSNYTAIKAIDNSRDLDSNKYKKNFVAWPPANECPKMLVFKKWSFSIDLNLAGAKVSMKNANGENVNLKLETLSNGYGMNTLVWEPEINVASLMDNTVYTVSVQLADGKTFSYKVKIIDVSVK